jgi:hypothetical protein
MEIVEVFWREAREVEPRCFGIVGWWCCHGGWWVSFLIGRKMMVFRD